MKKVIQTIALGGFFYLVPAIIFIILIEKALDLIRPLSHWLSVQFRLESALGAMAVLIISILFLALICYLLGRLLDLGMIRNWSSNLEEFLFLLFPGLQIIRFRLLKDSPNKIPWTPVLLREDPGWTVAFLTDDSLPGYLSFFLPDAPRIDAGSVKVISREECEYQEISMADALHAIRFFGKGMPTPKG